MLRKDIDKSEELTIVARQSFKEREYWSKKLSGELPKTGFPHYFKRTDSEADMERRMETLEFQLLPDITTKILKLCNQSDRRLYMILISTLFVLLDKYTGNRDIIIGMPVEKQEIEGDYINMVLAIRNQWQENTSFKELLLITRKIILEAIENQNYPIEMLLYDLGIEPDEKEFPLFNIAVLLENIHELKFLTPFPLNMIFVFNRIAEQIEGAVKYNRFFYERTYIERIVGHFILLLEKVLTDIDEPLSEINILSSEEKNQLLYTFNNISKLNIVSTDFKKNTIQEYFEAAVEKERNRIALIHENTHLSYEKLDEKANRWAHILSEKGVKIDVLVGMIVYRSIEMIAGMLGILKTGGAYLPIDPGYPLERILYIINDSGITLLATNTNQVETINFRGEWLWLNSEEDHGGYNSNKEASPNTRGTWGCAYVIYTSGSTGRPKGVVVEQRSIVNTLHWRKNYYQFSQRDTVLQIPSYSFDSSVEDIFTPLVSGAKLILLKGENPYEIQEIRKILMKFLVTHFLIVPNFYKIFVRELWESMKYLEKITVAGENFTEELVKAHFNQLKTVELYNEYGPTENSVCTTVYRFASNRTQVLIGKPINNVNCYILNPKGELVPIGVPGELYLSGEGIARGYLNQPELTAEKFDHDLWDYQDYHDKKKTNQKLLWGSRGRFSRKEPPGHKRIYKTGDLARWLFDGNIEFLGRIDYQVKIRGYRIELGEIENRILNYPGIKEVVVVVRGNIKDDRYICAYYISDCDCGTSELRDFLSMILPDYMIPLYFVRLEKIPLTPNGKVNRRALPEPDLIVSHGFIAPADEIEKKLTAIWSEVLEMEKEKISINDNFFHLGGHSLKATIMADIIYKELNVKIALAQIFGTPHIRGLSEYIKTLTKETQIPVEPVEKKEYYLLSSAQERLYIAQCLDIDNTVYNLPGLFPLPKWVKIEELEKYFSTLIKRNESLRTSFHMMAEKPVQKVHDQVEFEIEYNNLSTDYTRGGHSSFSTYYDSGDSYKPKKKIGNKSKVLEWSSTDDMKEGKNTPNLETQSEVFTKGDRAGRFFKESCPLPLEAMIKRYIRPFDLSRAPLLRVGLLGQLQSPASSSFHSQSGTTNSEVEIVNQNFLIVDMHHIISDEISLNIMVGEFLALASGETLAPLPIQYKDYACWQKIDQIQLTIQRQSGYWLQQLKGKIPELHMPLDYPRPSHFYFEGNTLSFTLEDSLEHGLKKLAKDENVTLFILLLTIFNVMLAKICAQEDIVVGTVVAGRRHADLRHIIGFFVNQMVLINSPGKEKNFYQFLQEVKNQVLEAFENQDYPLEELLEQLEIKRKPGQHPLFNVVFTLNRLETHNKHQNRQKKQWEIEGEFNVHNPTAKYDLVLACLERGETLSFSIEYASSLFKEETILRFIGYFKEITAIVLKDKRIRLENIRLSSQLVKTDSGPFHNNLEEFEI